MILFNVTYDIVTEESASEGDVEERGFVSENVRLRDALCDVRQTRTNECGGPTAVEASDSRVNEARWITITNGMEFLTGAVESRSLHIPDAVTASTRVRIARLLGVRI